jgi:hypothetical protein
LKIRIVVDPDFGKLFLKVNPDFQLLQEELPTGIANPSLRIRFRGAVAIPDFVFLHNLRDGDKRPVDLVHRAPGEQHGHRSKLLANSK